MRDGGMQGRGGPANFHRTGGRMQHGRSGFSGRPGGFHGGPGGFGGGMAGGGMMGGGFRIGPPGMWWKNPGIVQRLTLTPDQTKKMDDIFQASRIELIGLRAAVETENARLEPMLSANPPDTAKALLQIDKVAQARANLEKADARMLLGIRGVLTPDQWTRLHAGPGGFGRPGETPGAPQPGGGAGGPGGGGGRGPRNWGGPGGGDNFVAPNPQP
jgi:Spy/CpxP family protein refolding chaperone